MKLEKINDYSYKVEKEGKMNVPLVIYANDKLIKKMESDGALEQGVNVASCLPGIYDKSIMLSDAHRGYGFSIGGVAAIDSECGCITPGGIGFDINCGVRILTTNLSKEKVESKIKELLEVIFKNVPSGVGSESSIRLTDEQLEDVLKKGARWAVENGYGVEDDLEFCEENGEMKSADPSVVSQKAKSRGRKQLGTLGAGNHFLEVQIVDKIFDSDSGKTYGFDSEGKIAVMIHCGSRGLGHQVCSDYLRKMEDEFPDVMSSLPEKDLIYAPAGTKIADDYFKAMSAAANYAWANRHIIAHFVRKSFNEVFGDVEMNTVYDVAHNIAKLEEHEIDGSVKKVWVHRKGATRAFGPGRVEVPEKYREVGQPVLIPGSMGTSSWVLSGTEKAMEETFGSSAHGAGREMSRFAAKKQYRGEDVKKELELRNIFVKAASWKGISEEAPGAYKDISDVIEVTDKAGIAKKVVKLIPLGVIKG